MPDGLQHSAGPAHIVFVRLVEAHCSLVRRQAPAHAYDG